MDDTTVHPSRLPESYTIAASVGAVTTYTFEDVTDDYTPAVSFVTETLD